MEGMAVGMGVAIGVSEVGGDVLGVGERVIGVGEGVMGVGEGVIGVGEGAMAVEVAVLVGVGLDSVTT